MKKITLIFSFLIILISCKSKTPDVAIKPKPVAENKAASLDNKSEIMMKGNWTLTKITYPGADYLKVTSFQIADSKCFLGSQWHFISNNNKGSMSMKATNCVELSSPIVWSVSKEKMFSLKILKDAKANDVKVGFYLLLVNQTEKSFQLSDRIDVGGKMTEILYTFERN